MEGEAGGEMVEVLEGGGGGAIAHAGCFVGEGEELENKVPAF